MYKIQSYQKINTTLLKQNIVNDIDVITGAPVKYEIDTKRNEMKRNEMKRNKINTKRNKIKTKPTIGVKTKRMKPKQNEIYRNETKRNEIKTKRTKSKQNFKTKTKSKRNVFHVKAYKYKV